MGSNLTESEIEPCAFATAFDKILSGWDFSAISHLSTIIKLLDKPGEVLNGLDKFLQTAEGIGSVFFWVGFMVSMGLGVWWLLQRIRRGEQDSHFSLVELMGDVIWLGVFILPAATMGAYCGGLVDNRISADELNFLFSLSGLVVGAVVGFFGWRWATQ